MSRYYTKSKGNIPKRMYINKGPNHITGPYFSKQKPEPSEIQIEYGLDEETGDYIRLSPPLVKEIKGTRKKLDI